MSDRRVIRIFVQGRVQGVGYRAFLVREANGLGLAGWARNRSDGSVEAVAAGSAVAIAALIDTARRGPWLAQVEALSEESADEGDLLEIDGFVVAPTI